MKVTAVQNAMKKQLKKLEERKQRLQKVFFPEGVTFLNGELGTTSTGLFFNHLQVLETLESNLARLLGRF